MREYFVDGAGWNGKDSKIMITVSDGNLIEKVFRIPFTNVEAEYLAVIEALKLAKNGDIIHSDNKVVVFQILDKYACRTKHLFKYYIQARTIYKSKSVRLRWIRRKKNLAGRLLGR